MDVCGLSSSQTLYVHAAKWVCVACHFISNTTRCHNETHAMVRARAKERLVQGTRRGSTPHDASWHDVQETRSFVSENKTGPGAAVDYRHLCHLHAKIIIKDSFLKLPGRKLWLTVAGSDKGVINRRAVWSTISSRRWFQEPFVQLIYSPCQGARKDFYGAIWYHAPFGGSKRAVGIFACGRGISCHCCCVRKCWKYLRIRARAIPVTLPRVGYIPFLSRVRLIRRNLWLQTRFFSC